eukprot:1508764-Pyramimonas_sp.AAC.1
MNGPPIAPPTPVLTANSPSLVGGKMAVSRCLCLHGPACSGWTSAGIAVTNASQLALPKALLRSFKLAPKLHPAFRGLHPATLEAMMGPSLLRCFWKP